MLSVKIKPSVQIGQIPVHQAFLSPSEQADLLSIIFLQARQNLEELVSGIHYELDRDLKLPRFNRERPAVEELQERAQAGLQNKGLTDHHYQERLNRSCPSSTRWALMIISSLSGTSLRFDAVRATIWVWVGVRQSEASVAYALDITGLTQSSMTSSLSAFKPRTLQHARYRYYIPDIYRETSYAMSKNAMAVCTQPRLLPT